MTLSGLLGQNEEAINEFVEAASSEERRLLFADIWDRIRQKGLYGGQPSSENSNNGLHLARLALSAATQTADAELLREAWCMMAYTLNANEQYEESLEYYQQAIEGLERVDDHARAARNRLGYLTALSMAGRHSEAIEVGLEAERWFLSSRDDEGYARLCVNLGNVYQRLDQYARSLELHENAIKYFTTTQNNQALGQVYLNAGNSLGCLNRFEEADDFYAASERIGERLSLTDLTVQARYNRAYLYFLRGRNLQAVEQFGKLRGFFIENASYRHIALCDLDETEIYLQLNLPNDAARLARSAANAFEVLHMRYEQAKATGFLGVALTQNRQFGDALQVFRSAQSLFEQENNRYWIAMLKLYRAEVLYALGRVWEARSLAASAYTAFDDSNVDSKRVVTMILLGRIAADMNQDADVAQYVRKIKEWTTHGSNPLLLFPCHAFCGYIAERAGNLDEAQRLYELAAGEIESRSTHLHHDELRISFFPGKQAVYETLVRLTFRDSTRQPDLVNAYVWCQRAKSTGMIDLAVHHLPSIRSHGDEALLSRVSRIRDELNGAYLHLRSEKADMPSLTNLSSIQIKENELLRSLRELSEVDPVYVSLQYASTTALEGLQSLLPSDKTLVEFFTMDNEVVAFVISRDRAGIFRHLSPLARIRYLEDQLRGHLSKISESYQHRREVPELSPEFANAQLAELYNRLIQPLRHELQTPGLIIVPHGILHYIPFAALFDGKDYLLDCFDINHSPSALFLRSALQREPVHEKRSLVLGRPLASGDPEFIALQKVASDAEWRLGDGFTRDRMINEPLRCEFVHLSTDVHFRHDNPMFSAVRCADSWITAVDLYSMSCETNLVTLSGNKIGLNPAAGSHSMTAITESLLYAGARSVLNTLWNVDITTTGDFLEVFYREWRSGVAKCIALRRAAATIRNTRRHPFFWAPYFVVGQD
jgi:tetratricopeptide (TPR) repeat protein